jgi:thymidylate kinase
VRAGYLALARAEPERVHLIDAAAPMAQVERDIGAILQSLTARAPA